MKKIILAVLCFCTIFTSVFAQKSPTHNEVKRYFEKRMQIDFRSQAFKSIELTSDEIVIFDPILKSYLEEKDVLLEKKIKLIESYRDEMKEDDNRENQNEDRADFVEDYWELEIKEAELSMRYFDILEDKIPVEKAIKFFIYEESIQDRIKRNSLTSILPAIDDMDRLVDKALVSRGKTKTSAINKSYGSMNEASAKDYKRYIDKRLEMNFRNESIKAIDLTADEIIAFDPVFRKYMAKRERLLEKKIRLLEDLRDELSENDSDANENEDAADFVEDYWELEIDDMQLRKNSFDVLEDKINENKAIKFFLFEEAVQNRIKSYVFESMVPAVIMIKKIPLTKVPHHSSTSVEIDTEVKMGNGLSKSTNESIENFDKWVKTNRGQVDLSHEYSANGMKALVQSLEMIKSDLNLNVKDFEKHKEMILATANQITINYKETNHADKTKKAFMAIATMMNEMSASKDGTLKRTAMSIKNDMLMTKQASKIYAFFDQANRQLQKMKNRVK